MRGIEVYSLALNPLFPIAGRFEEPFPGPDMSDAGRKQ
jgi:hypothetical protein